MSEFTIYDDAPDTPERREALRSLSAMYDRLSRGSAFEPICITDVVWNDYLDYAHETTWTSHMEGDIEE